MSSNPSASSYGRSRLLLATAAVIAVGSVIYFYFELQGLRAEYARQAQLNEVNLRIVAGEASRQRESTQAQLVAIREENEAARRQAELSRELQQAGSPGQIASYKDRAVSIARGHILGKTMNEVTSQVVAMVLRTDQSGSVSLLTNGERVLMQAALDDWGGQVESATVRSEFQSLLDERPRPAGSGDRRGRSCHAGIPQGQYKLPRLEPGLFHCGRLCEPGRCPRPERADAAALERAVPAQAR